jgi:hypothetical protein
MAEHRFERTVRTESNAVAKRIEDCMVHEEHPRHGNGVPQSHSNAHIAAMTRVRSRRIDARKVPGFTRLDVNRRGVDAVRLATG